MAINQRKYQFDDGMVVWHKECTTRKDAIRVFCMECMGMDRLKKMPKSYAVKEIKECLDPVCPLFPFRLGKNPFSRRKGNPEALQKARSIVQN